MHIFSGSAFFKDKLRIAFIIVSFFSVLILFGRTFSSYFFQDDWFSLQISNAQSFGEVINFFTFRNDVIYYRPLGMQVIFFINQMLFGINTLPFRVLTLVFHLFNGILVYQLLMVFVKKKTISYAGAFLYLVSAIHATLFYWAATIAFVMAPFFYFSAFLCYVKNRKALSFLLFILGLFVNELLIIFPLIITIWECILMTGFRVKPGMTKLFAFWITVGSYFIFRFSLGTPPTSGSYAVSLNIKQLFFNLRDYLLWTFNWPEEVHNQFVRFGILNQTFFKEFFNYILVWELLLVLTILFFIFIGVKSLQAKKTEIFKLFCFGTAWFFITLSPVFFFSNHLFSYYLPIPFFGILLIWLVGVDRFFSQLSQKILIPVAMVIWFAASFATIRFNTFIHWAPRRAEIAQKIITDLETKQHPEIGGKVYIDGGDESFWALSDQNALQVYFDDPILKTIYVK